eukprot:scaffold87726_cov55-Phaeocystis_antarctica.AAC.1
MFGQAAARFLFEEPSADETRKSFFSPRKPPSGAAHTSVQERWRSRVQGARGGGSSSRAGSLERAPRSAHRRASVPGPPPILDPASGPPLWSFRTLDLRESPCAACGS